MRDDAFEPDIHGLQRSVEALLEAHGADTSEQLPGTLPVHELGEISTLEKLAPLVLGGVQRLGAADALAHMDPPTPWITWAMAMWNASLNQNLWHPDTSPAARRIEERVVSWIAPFFGIGGIHMTPGSTVANLTALWAARELRSIKTVAASNASHLSIEKAAHILGTNYRTLPADDCGRLTAHALNSDLSDAALVLTAGTTNAGAIDDLALAGRAAWTHVDAAGPAP
ncbi:MAG: pyridoxal-dependent decarboxylase [Geminicoccaceae bacterium]